MVDKNSPWYMDEETAAEEVAKATPKPDNIIFRMNAITETNFKSWSDFLINNPKPTPEGVRSMADAHNIKKLENYLDLVQTMKIVAEYDPELGDKIVIDETVPDNYVQMSNATIQMAEYYFVPFKDITV